MTKPKEDPPLDSSDACMLMHTALRKACDSKITSAAYNLIHLIELKPDRYNPWLLLGELVADKRNAGMKPVTALQQSIVAMSDIFQDRLRKARDSTAETVAVPDNARQWMLVLQCTLECFDKNDLEGMASYLEEG
jgi:hypothetical protein